MILKNEEDITMTTRLRLIIFCVILAVPALLFAETPPWERLMEPTEPDTEAIKKAAEEAAKPKPVVEPAPQPVVSKKERERIEKAQKEADKKEQKRIEREKKEAEKREKERLKQERKDREKREKEKKNAPPPPLAPAPEIPAQMQPQPVPARSREPAPPPAVPVPEPKKQPEPSKSEATPSKPVEPVKTEVAPSEPAKAEAAPPKPSEPVKTEAAPPKPSEPVKAEAAPPKPSEPAKAEAASPKPSEPVKTETAPPKPSEPAKAEAAPIKPSEPAKAEAAPIKPSEPVKAEVAPPKPSEPVKPEAAPPKPSEPAKAEAAPPKPAEPAKPVKAPSKPVEPVSPAPVVAEPSPTASETAAEEAPVQETPKSEKKRLDGGFRVGLRAALGIGGFGGHEPVYLGPAAAEISGGKMSDADVYLRDENGVPIYRHVFYDREIELGASLSGGVSVVFLSRINGLLSLSCGAQYSFYTASGEYVHKMDEFRMPNDDADFWPVSEASVELHSLEIPVLFRISAEEALGYPVYAEAGPQIGFNLYARKMAYEGGVMNKNAVLIWKPNLSVVNFGPVFGAGIDLDRASVDLRVHFGLMKYQETQGGRPWSITVGLTSCL
jgi:hypothetical protein